MRKAKPLGMKLFGGQLRRWWPFALRSSILLPNQDGRLSIEKAASVSSFGDVCAVNRERAIGSLTNPHGDVGNMNEAAFPTNSKKQFGVLSCPSMAVSMPLVSYMAGIEARHTAECMLKVG